MFFFGVVLSAESYVEEEEPRKKGIMYEDLRLKNRENYEVTLTQKAESMLKTSQDKEPRRPTKEGELADFLSCTLESKI